MNSMIKQEYTVREIADRLKVSKPTVQRKIKELSIQPIKKVDNKHIYYGLEDIKKIVNSICKEENAFAKCFATSSNVSQSEVCESQSEAESSNVSQNVSQSEAESPKNATDKGSEAIDVLLAMLQEEIKKKDLELAKKDERIENLENKLQEAHLEILNFGKNAQFIAAANETNKYLEHKEDNNPVEETKNKKGFFSRLFR